MTLRFYKISTRQNSGKQPFKTMQIQGACLDKFYNKCIVFAPRMASQNGKHISSVAILQIFEPAP